MINADLFEPVRDETALLQPWKPRALAHDQWPPNYPAVYVWRIQTLERLRNDDAALQSARDYYSTRPAEFIQHWMDTYNPRKSTDKWMPFVFFNRQEQFIDYLEGLRADSENGLVEKCRDIGATWLVCAYSVWCWLFIPDFAFGWGSRKQDLVDSAGDPDSIFEKMRLLIRRLPDVWVPTGFKWRNHATEMKLINPANGATITGESGDGIGRGGRKSMYGKDEAQPLHSRILTPTGWQTMDDMRVGSLVIGANGGCRMVTHINDVGEAETYRLTFRDGSSVECSENHLWTVKNRIGKHETMTIRTNQMVQNCVYNSPGGQRQYRYEIPITQPVQFFNETVLPLDPYVTGVLIGDGSIASGVVSFTSADIEIVMNVAQRLPIGCKVTYAGKYAYRIVDVRGRQGNKPSARSRARTAIVAAGIAGYRSYEKSIPDRYKFASINDRLELLQGLMDTDGSASGGTITYHTCSKKLADDVQFIVQSLGGVASLNLKPDHRGFRDMYCLHVSLPEYMSPFKLTRKIDSFSRKIKFNRSIIKIEPIGKQIVRCITVDSHDGLYLTDHCIVTHNSAHYERPEKIESALGDNTDIQLDISSVNGLGNVFHRRREAGIDWVPGCSIEKGYTRVFVFDWRDHPEKNQAWYDQRKARAEREGLQHVFAQEVDRNYSAAVMNTIIDYEWITSAIDAHLKVPYLRIPPPNTWMAGLDVADGGIDRNALALRQWIILRHVEDWGERDVGVTTRRTIDTLKPYRGLKVQYDCIGIGSAVKSEFNRLIDSGVITRNDYDLVPWDAGAKVMNGYDRIIPNDEQSMMNRDFFHNFKAQAWWSVRTRFYKTWRAVTMGDIYPADELISLDSSMPKLAAVMKELAQATSKPAQDLSLLVDKKPSGTRSPNMADAVIECFFPAPDQGGTPVIGSYTG